MLFYTENLPPESLLVGLVMASVERQGKKEQREALLSADDVLAAVLRGKNAPSGLAGELVQVGGDATTGRGLIAVHAPGFQP